MDVLETLVRASSPPPPKSANSSNGGFPASVDLTDLLIKSAFPAAVQCTLRSEDNSIMQVSESRLHNFFQKNETANLAF